jgi:hypothetical protein
MSNVLETTYLLYLVELINARKHCIALQAIFPLKRSLSSFTLSGFRNQFLKIYFFFRKKRTQFLVSLPSSEQKMAYILMITSNNLLSVKEEKSEKDGEKMLAKLLR